MTDAPSYLFCQSRNPRPFLDYGEGIYLIDETGKRYIDGSWGAMVSNIGQPNPRALARTKGQMHKATFGYRLHFRTHRSEDLAAKTVAMFRRLDWTEIDRFNDDPYAQVFFEKRQ